MKGILEKLCTDALENYYKYGTTDFVDAFEENIVFFTPTYNRMIVGKEDVIRYFTEGGKKLELTIDNMATRLIPLKADAMIIIADYNLFACYPDARIMRFVQHTLVALHKRKQKSGEYKWMCPFIHISNAGEKSSLSDDKKVSLTQYEQDILRSFMRDRNTIKKVILSGEGGSTHYIPEDSIRYIEGGKGVQCYVHTDNGMLTVNHLMKDVIAKLPDYFYRCHASYIVNLRCVKCIGNYRITLENGEEIPVPAKKYSQVKNDISTWMAGGTI